MSAAAHEGTGPLQRAWAAWQRFWFTPADPTPLCLMRIVAGLLVLYVHVAYTFDLHAFFGPDGWYGTAQADRERREWPNFAPQSSWQTEPRFRMPQIAEQRRALRVFMDAVVRDLKTRPAGDREDRPTVLRMLRYLPIDPESRTEVLRYLQNLPADFAERDQELKKMVEAGPPKDAPPEVGKAAKSEPELPSFLLSLSPKQRELFRLDAHVFLDVLPAERALRSQLFAVFQLEGARDLGVLADLIETRLPRDDAARQAYLDYCERWTCPPDDPDIVAKGHTVYSPFFHIYNPRALELMHAANLLLIVLFTVGFCTRVTGVLAWLATLAYIQRDPLTLFGQDTMMNLCMVYLILSPCGELWSVDWLLARYRAGRAALRGGPRPADAGPRRSVSAGFAIRLLQVQYCFMYLSAGLSKLKGDSWWSGTATFLTMTNPEFSPLHIGLFRGFVVWLCKDNHRLLWELYMNATVIFTLVLEIGLPFLIWTRLRPVVLAGAILLHFGIALNMGLIVFSLFMFTLQLAWMPPGAIRRVFARPPSKLERARLRYSDDDPRQLRAAAAAYALDVWGQVDFDDRAARGRQEPAQLIAGGEAASGYALARKLTGVLTLTQPLAWVLRLPGVAQLGRAVWGGGVTAAPAAERDEAARKRGQKPVASR
jgi:hypothetical protein